MNKILPKKYDEFLEKSYWDKFFNKLKKSSDEYFEWYGEYKDFASILQSHVTKENTILNIGCGKSLLSEQMYDKGYENQVNIDFSDKVVAEMAERSKNKRPKMVYETMDIFNMSYKDDSYDVILDKGALDALFPKDTQENCEKIQFLFKEIERILNKNGKYICISLLQTHILRELLAYFTKRNYKIEITEFLIKKSKLFPYLVALTKTETPNNDQITLSLKNENNEKKVLNSIEVQKKISETQTYSLFMSSIRTLKAGQRVSIDIWDQKNKNSNVPRYTIMICDSNDTKILSQKTCGCFITPQGRECAYLFGTEEGNFELLSQTNMSRLLIATLNPGHEFINLKVVQEELSEVVPGLIPKDCSNPKVPFMTDGDEIGERAILYEDPEMFIEEHTLEDEMTYRSLILKSNLGQVQSEARLKYYDAEERKKTHPQAEELTKLSLLPNKKGRVVGIDESFLAFECHRTMIAGLGFISKGLTEKKSCKALILGDALAHVKNLLEKQDNKTETDNKKEESTEKTDKTEPEEHKTSDEKGVDNQIGLYDVIIVDINDSSSGSKLSPPKEFLDQEFLKGLKRLLTETGVLMMNIIPSEIGILDTCLKDINKVFDAVYLAKPETEVNYVAFLPNIDIKREMSQDGNELLCVEENQIPSKKDLEIAFKNMAKTLNVKWDVTMNLDQYCGEITLKYPLLKANPFQLTNVQMSKGEGEYTNKTKEMYLEDKEKVTKSQRKKKKNKKR